MDSKKEECINEKKSKEINIIPLPMFAAKGNALFFHPDWIIEPLKKGLRVLIVVSGNEIKFFTARMMEIEVKNNRIIQELNKINDDLILDALLYSNSFIVNSDTIHLRYSSELWKKVECVILDVIRINKIDVRKIPLLLRKELIQEINDKYTWKVIQPIEYAKDLKKDQLKNKSEDFFDGVVAKNIHSLYESGISSENWIKIQPSSKDTAHVIGLTFQNEDDNCFRGLLLGSKEGDSWILRGECEKGITKHQKEKLLPVIMSHYAGNPVITLSLPTSQKIKWVDPAIRIQYSFTHTTKKGNRKNLFFLGMK